jgi:hypothetical protein
MIMTDTKIKSLNQPGDYYFRSLCSKWHTDARKDHLQYRLHIQYFNQKNGFSFIVKGLKITEIKLVSGCFVLTLIKNILNQGYTSVHYEKKDFVYAGNPPISGAFLCGVALQIQGYEI